MTNIKKKMGRISTNQQWMQRLRFMDPTNPEEVQLTVDFINEEIESTGYNLIAAIADKMMDEDYYTFQMTIEQEHGDYDPEMVELFKVKVGMAVSAMMERTLTDGNGRFCGSSYEHQVADDEGFYPMLENLIYGDGDNLDWYELHRVSPLNEGQLTKIADKFKKQPWYKKLIKIMEDADDELYDYAANISARY